MDPREEYYARRLDDDSVSYENYNRPNCEVCLNLAYTYDLMEGTLHRSLQDFGISLPAFNLLKILLHQDNQCTPLNEIGELMLTSRANITGLVDGLAKKGLVERIPHPTDRRVKLARLLPEGRAFLDHYMPEHLRVINEIFHSVTPDEQIQLVKLLKKIRTDLTSP